MPDNGVTNWPADDGLNLPSDEAGTAPTSAGDGTYVFFEWMRRVTGMLRAIHTDLNVGKVAALPMGNHKITGLTDGTAATDAATLGQVQAQDPTQLGIHANLFRASAGSPSQSVARSSGGAVGGVPAWLFDAASDESIAGSIFVPYPWATVDVILLWGNVAATTGDVVWQTWTLGAIADGDSIVGVSNAATTAAAYNVISKVKYTTVATGIAVAQNQLFQIGVLRDADNVLDTLANDAEVYGVILRKAS